MIARTPHEGGIAVAGYAADPRRHAGVRDRPRRNGQPALHGKAVTAGHHSGQYRARNVAVTARAVAAMRGSARRHGAKHGYADGVGDAEPVNAGLRDADSLACASSERSRASKAALAIVVLVVCVAFCCLRLRLRLGKAVLVCVERVLP